MHMGPGWASNRLRQGLRLAQHSARGPGMKICGHREQWIAQGSGFRDVREGGLLREDVAGEE